MPLKYYLIDNPMTPDPADRMAISVVNRNFNIDNVIDEMISRGSTVTKAEALSVFEEFTRAIEVLVKDGNSVNTPLFIVSPGVSGAFANDDQAFDRAYHRVRLRIRPGARLRQLEEGIPVEKITAERSQPVLLHFHDNVSDTIDDVITPAGGARIVGDFLKFDEADNSQGIFFINTVNGMPVRISSRLLKNKPSELIFMVPGDMPTGTYRLEVRVIFKGSKTLRTGSLPYELVLS